MPDTQNNDTPKGNPAKPQDVSKSETTARPESPKPKSPKSGTTAQRASVERQMAQLRSEVSRISEALAHTETEHQGARPAQGVTEVIRENPGTAATVLTATALLGVLVGFVLGQSTDRHHSRWY